MKKYWWIIGIVIIGLIIGIVNANATKVVEERLDGIGGNNYSKAYEYVEEWCNVWRPLALTEHIDEEGVYHGYGIIYGDEFEYEYGLKCTKSNIEYIMETVFKCESGVVVSGFIDGRTIYSMTIKSNNGEQLEGCETEKAEMIFMVVYD